MVISICELFRVVFIYGECVVLVVVVIVVIVAFRGGVISCL